MFCANMPHYDESFIHDDDQNQRRNKRSYHVYKTNVTPLGFLDPGNMIQALDERGTSVIKRNIRNIKHRGNRYKPETTTSHYVPILRSKTPDRLVTCYPKISSFDPKKLYDMRNNNIPSLTPCKSFDNLTLRQDGQRVFVKDKIRNGKSLQDLVREESIKHYVSPAEDYLVSRKGDFKNCYSVVEARLKPVQRRISRGAVAPGVGVYRKICADNRSEKHDKENEACGEAGSGHRGSLRGANKLARRARSFKDDLLERISNMRSPVQPPHPAHLASNIRSHSPLSPKPRSAGAKAGPPEENEITPAKELERLVKEVTFGLKHFSDVITKRKLEMLPDNGTIVFESIANIHKAIKPYCSRSPQLTSAASRLCSSLATLIRLCDDVTAGEVREAAQDGEAEDATEERAGAVVRDVTAAVAEAAALAAQVMARPALKPRPPVVAQRNSLPDIPLTPKELSSLSGGAAAGAGAGAPAGPGGVRASHSSESVLEAPDAPPPKPARPERKIDSAPPLPPKRKSANDDSFLGLSADRLSLRSRSSGSLDSMLHGSRDAADATDSGLLDAAPSADFIGICSCNDLDEMRSSVESHESRARADRHRFSNESGFVSVGHAEASAEHGFASVGHAEASAEHGFVSSFSSHLYSTHSDSSFESTEYVTQVRCGTRAAAGLGGGGGGGGGCGLGGAGDGLASVARDGGETPPELPAKTRRNIRTDVQRYFPDVEMRRTPPFSAPEGRPHTSADHGPQRPPPLPLKKRHMFQSVAYSVMAYMEMFGNCSHALDGLPAADPEAPPDMFRHSIHTYNSTSVQRSSSGTTSLGHHRVSRTMASSSTVHHLSAPPPRFAAPSTGDRRPPSAAERPRRGPHSPATPSPTSGSRCGGSEDGASTETSGGGGPGPASPRPSPPALPPKMSRSKQAPSCGGESAPPEPRPRPRPAEPPAEPPAGTPSLDASSDEMYVSLSSPRKFPVEEEEPPPSPAPSQRSESSTEPAAAMETNSAAESDPDDIILQTEVGGWLSLKGANKEGPEVRGGHPDALIVLATKATKNFAYQEAFLATYRTWVSPCELVRKLVRRSRHHRARPHELRCTLGLLARTVADLTMADLERTLMREIMEFIYWLVEAEELPISKALRQILVDKQKQLHFQRTNNRYEYETPCYGSVSLRRDTLLDFKASDLAEQMTSLDSALFVRITTAEVLSWPRDQSEESSPNLTRFTEHFNKMSYWARSRILEQYEAREREKYAAKVLKVMKSLRKLNNFNSYLALVSALDCPPVRRLGWPRGVADALRDHCGLIDSSHSFRSYRQALADTPPPCIPYIGLVLQDLTFVHEGNPDLLPDGNVNFTKRLQQYNIMENMKRFHKEQYKFKKNERIRAMFNEFDDVLSEETMWQISETIKPRGGRSRDASAPSPPAVC